jgi:alkanesulfonate monooxygenase SsuD/methylene tetrahydromethanopterin reductase-like flavin-dependent oxidoreductase (luciferase family)
MVTTGVVVRPEQPPEELRTSVERAEQAGVDQLWFWEDCFRTGGLTAAASALAWTERLHVGIGLLPVPLRNPALAAMEIATLARLFPGRLTVTLGHGVLPWMRQVGAGVDSPMTLLREHTTAVRDLLRGETVSTSGRYVSLDDVALDWPPQQPPRLLIGARGPKTIELAAELADGVLLDTVTDPDVVRRARALVDDRAVYAFAPLAPGTPADGIRARVDELAEAGADAVIVHGTDEAPGMPEELSVFG